MAPEPALGFAGGEMDDGSSQSGVTVLKLLLYSIVPKIDRSLTDVTIQINK